MQNAISSAKTLFATPLFLFLAFSASAQTALSVGPPRLYFVTNDVGQAQYLEIVNSSADYPLELAVSVEDWAYDTFGNNVMASRGTLPTSCADWLSISETAFSLQPGETKRLQVSLQVPKDVSPADSLPVRTAMLFVSQLNPRGSDQDPQEGANIRLSLRSGVKVYHRFGGKDKADIDITDLKYVADTAGSFLELSCAVTGNTWLEGRVQTEFINQDTGEKKTSAEQTIYCLPGDKRRLYIPLPEGLPAGNYQASVMLFYDADGLVKAAEMELEV